MIHCITSKEIRRAFVWLINFQFFLITHSAWLKTRIAMTAHVCLCTWKDNTLQQGGNNGCSYEKQGREMWIFYRRGSFLFNKFFSHLNNNTDDNSSAPDGVPCNARIPHETSGCLLRAESTQAATYSMCEAWVYACVLRQTNDSST